MSATPRSTTFLPGALALSTDGVLGEALYPVVRVDAVQGGLVATDGGYEVVLVGEFPARGAVVPAGTYPGQITDELLGARVRFVGNGVDLEGAIGPAGVFRGRPGWGKDPRPFGANADWTTRASTLRVYSPPLPEGTYDLHVSDWPFEAVTVVVLGAITVVKRTYHTELYAIRVEVPAPRDVGPRSINQESWQ